MTKITRENGQLFLHDDDQITTIETLKFTSDGYLKIPVNSSGRTLVKFTKVENLQDGEFYELKEKVEKNFSNSPRISQKSIVEYLSDEDKVLYNELMEKARKAYEEAHKKVELTPLEKAKLQYQKALEKLKKLEEEAGV